MSAMRQEGNPWPPSPLPLGFRFLPRDEELVHYLRLTIDGHPVPPLAFEFDVFRTEPWNLPGDVTEERYFFCGIKNIAKFGDSSVPRKRVAGAYGYWKLTGTEKQVITRTLRAIKSRLHFCEGDDDDDDDDDDEVDDEEGGGGGSTNVAQAQPKWIMHEFRPQYRENQIGRINGQRTECFRRDPNAIVPRSTLQGLPNPGSTGPNS